MHYGYTKQLSMPFSSAVEAARQALATEGFGVLTEIDVQATLKKKLDADVGRYIILGACNPPFAYKAIQAEHEIGLLLPCNVIVYEKVGGVFVSALVPSVAMQMIDNPALRSIAQSVEQKLTAAVDSISS